MSETTFLSAVLFLLFALICGSLIQWIVSSFKSYRPPVSILWFAFGMLISLITVLVVPEVINPQDPGLTHIDINPEHPLGLLGIGIAEAARIHSSVLYYIVLPILLYDATQQISWHHFRKSLRTGLLLAIVGVVFQVAVIGLLMQYSFTRPVTMDANNRDLDSLAESPDAALQSGSGGLERGLDSHLLKSFQPSFSQNPDLNFSLSAPPAFFDISDSLRDSLPTPDTSLTPVPSDHREIVDTFEPHQGSLRRQLGFLWRGPSVMKPGHAAMPPRGMGNMMAHGPSLSFSMMTAAAVASTDPIAVISILEDMDAPAQFSSLFDCEALINDGSSIFLFTFFKSLTRGNQQTWTESLGRFATLLIVGPLSGFVAASLMYRWLKHYRWFPYDKTIAVVFMSYLVFYVAEIYLLTSGPLAIVVYGLYFKVSLTSAVSSELSPRPMPRLHSRLRRPRCITTL